MKVSKNYQLFVNGELYNVYSTLREASRVVSGLKLINEQDFTYEIITELNIIRTLRTGTKTEDFSKLMNSAMKKTRAKKKSRKVKKETKVLVNAADRETTTF